MPLKEPLLILLLELQSNPRGQCLQKGLLAPCGRVASGSGGSRARLYFDFFFHSFIPHTFTKCTALGFYLLKMLKLIEICWFKNS